MTGEPMAYVGKCRQCGGAYMLIMDKPEHSQSVAAEVRKVIDSGDTVERTTVDEARAAWKNHTCECEAVEDLEAPSPEAVRAAELERLAAWNAGQPRKVAR